MKDTVTSVAQVVGANASAWTLALADINGFLTALSLVLTTGYTIYKFIKDKKKEEQ
jgi:hypothetical protein